MKVNINFSYNQRITNFKTNIDELLVFKKTFSHKSEIIVLSITCLDKDIQFLLNEYTSINSPCINIKANGISILI